MRAVLRATRAERRRARPTAAANGVGLIAFVFMGLVRGARVLCRNYDTPPKHGKGISGRRARTHTKI